VSPGLRPRLIALRALGLGDLLTTVPALRALARAFPHHRRLLAAPEWLAPLLPLIVEDGRPCLHGLAELDGLDGDPGQLPRRADVAVDLHGRGPESHRLLLATKPRQLLAFRNEKLAETSGMPHWEPSEHETKRWCRLLQHFGIAADPSELEICRPVVALPDEVHGATLLHPGAASAARRWPPERWARFARAEREAGHEVLITGSRAELGLARSIAVAAGLDPRRQPAGRTDLLCLTALVAAAGTVICGDTGVAHLATALGVPSVLLFGPTSPQLWGPPEHLPMHRVLWEGRTGDPHAQRIDPGLLEIEVETVLDQLPRTRAATVA
jgi:ADP-heptose:LPS heptosyltransferase